MLTGYFLAGKRYSLGQAVRVFVRIPFKSRSYSTFQFAGFIITLGIILATLSAPRRRTSPSSSINVTTSSNDSADWLSDNAQYVAGIALLSVALFFSAWLGLWQEQTYKMYGKKWREALFYSVSPIGHPFTTILSPDEKISTFCRYRSSCRFSLRSHRLSNRSPCLHL